MAKDPYRDSKENIMKFIDKADKSISPGFTSVFGNQRRKCKIRLLTGYKIIKASEGENCEELAYVCAEKSGKITYDDYASSSLAKRYSKYLSGKLDLRPVVLVEKGKRYFEVIPRPVGLIFPEDVDRLEWEKTMLNIDRNSADCINEKIKNLQKRTLFQRIVCRICGIR